MAPCWRLLSNTSLDSRRSARATQLRRTTLLVAVSIPRSLLKKPCLRCSDPSLG